MRTVSTETADLNDVSLKYEYISENNKFFDKFSEAHIVERLIYENMKKNIDMLLSSQSLTQHF